MKSQEPAGTTIWQPFARSVRNNVLGEIGVQLVRVGGMVVLSRSLAPSDFGLFRVQVITAAILMVVNELGMPETLVQRRDLRAEHAVTASCLNFLMSTFTAGLLYVMAPLIARAMALPALLPTLRLLCIPLVFEGIAAISSARLTRRLEFGKLVAAEVAAEVAFVLAAIGLLLLKMPRWSLAAGLSARMCGHALMLFAAEPYLPLGRPSLRAVLELRGFASGVLAGRLLSYVSSNADYLMVGRLLGSTALGFYSMAWDLLRFVPNRLDKVAGRLTLPAFSRLQHDPDELRRAFLDFLNYMSRLVLPILVWIAIAAPELLGGIYGPQWVPAAMPLRILSVGLISFGLRAGMGGVFYSKGRPILDFYLHSLRFGLIVVAVFSTSGSGLIGVSVAMSLVELVISGLGQTMAFRLIDTNFTRVAASLWPSLRTAAVCAAGAFLAKALAHGFQLEPVIALAAMATAAGAGFLWLEADSAKELVENALGASGSVGGAAGD